VENDPRIVCVGSNLESQVILDGLLDLKANIVGLVTLPPKSGITVSDYVDLHQLCRDKSIRVIDTEDINGRDTIKSLESLAPDYIFTLGWSQLFKKNLLAIPRRFVVGSHPSPLPEGRGRAPIPWTILQESKKGAVTLFRMEQGVDSGPILIQKWFDMPERPYAMDVYLIAARTLKNAYCKLYDEIKIGNCTETVQDLSKASFRAKRLPEDGHIDFSKNAEEIERLIRAVSEPYPGAFTFYGGRRVSIWRASADKVPPYLGTIGQILTKREEKLVVQGGDRAVWVWKFTIDGESVDPSFFDIGSKFGFNLEIELISLRRELESLKKRIR
jgi:methionyl-tRNA formyltransferase